MPRAKTLRIKESALRAMYASAESVSAEWRARDERWGQDTWQVAAVEAMMLPGVWQHLQHQAARESHGGWAPRAYDHYGPIRRARVDAARSACAGLPGYAMPNWTTVGAPAGTVLDGIRRELWGWSAAERISTLADILAGGAGLTDAQRESIGGRARADLATYNIRIV